RKRSAERGFTLIELLVVIAIIGILASVVLASLNVARKKSRDARRVADIKQLQLALELYFDGNSQAYPPTASWIAELSTANKCGGAACIPVVPADPLTGSYNYFQCSQTKYHLGTSLEDNQNPALASDLDQPTSTCGGAGDFATGAGNDAAKCVTGDKGLYCFDVSP
ncbi:MAG: type II secretion system protein, partial [Candidatus Sungbacteria bacterium]|nr:type II secretion system protein [Candidatus Sungbacteria bacterium]